MKRFTYVLGDGFQDNGIYIHPTRVVDLLNQFYEENLSLKEELKHRVYVDIDDERGCNNCKHDKGGICEIRLEGTHSWLEGVSECALKDWELKV